MTLSLAPSLQVIDSDDEEFPGADDDLAVMARLRAQALAASREASDIFEGEVTV